MAGKVKKLVLLGRSKKLFVQRGRGGESKRKGKGKGERKGRGKKKKKKRLIPDEGRKMDTAYRP